LHRAGAERHVSESSNDDTTSCAEADDPGDNSCQVTIQLPGRAASGFDDFYDYSDSDFDDGE
jgi:hypothetical protein